MRDDIYFMKRALSLAKRAQWRTSPNPMVGAVIVKDGRIISEGYHKRAGMPHAEAEAIMNAKESLKGATLYVTLEPCCHRNKRTPPCTDVIISSGISRVVIAMKDPNPLVSGKGVEILKQQGIKVELGLLEEEAKKLNEFYIKYITTKTPFVIMKIAMTLDGKIATPEGESKWITSEESRKIVHRLRSRVDAVLSAYGTVLSDNSRFTSRIRGGRDPLRVIIDPELKIPLDFHVYNPPPGTVVVVKEELINSDKAKEMLKRGVELIPTNSPKVNLVELMKKLGERGIISLMIEGGSSLNAYALRDGIVDKLIIFIAPKIIGGRHSYSCVGGDFYRKLSEAYEVERLTVKKLSRDILFEGYIKKA